jgi:threonine/homoserine/homoserine lactone efflux protein
MARCVSGLPDMTAPLLLAYLLAAGLLTLTPGVDTLLVLRTAALEGARPAFLAAAGISLGCVGWGLIVAAGLGAVLASSEGAYALLRWAGAAYLVYLGLRMLIAPRRTFAAPATAAVRPEVPDSRAWLWRGLVTNLLNPKVGVFYVSFLPQFIPAGSDIPRMTVLLATVHAALGLTWCCALIAATRPLSGLLARPGVITFLDRLTGGVLVAFGCRLAWSRSV